MPLRNLGRTAIVVAVVAAGLAVAAPARAAGLSVEVACEPLSRFRVLCLSNVTGGTGPYARRWFYNDTYFSSQDDRITTSWSCTQRGPNVYRLAVIDANFEIVFASSATGCNTGNP